MPHIENKLAEIKKKYKEYKDAAAGESKSFIQKYLRSEIWRFFIDGVRQNEGATLIKYFEEYQKKYLERKGYKEPIFEKKLSGIINMKLSPNEPYYQVIQSLKQNLQDTMIKLGEKNADLTLEEFCLRDVGWIPFEATEPGYLKALVTILLEHEQKLQQGGEAKKIDIAFIQNLHKKATKEVKQLNRIIPGNFRNNSETSFIIDDMSLTKAGLEELLGKIRGDAKNSLAGHSFEIRGSDGKDLLKKHNAEEIMGIINSGQPCTIVSKINPGLEEVSVSAKIERLVQILLDRYYETMEQSKTDKEKIVAMIELVRDLEQLHPFNDANCRTFCMSLFSYLLMQNGFPPPILNNPNNFEGHSIQEMLTETIQGMTDTMALATKEITKLNGVSTNDILEVTTEEEKAYATGLGIVVSPAAESKLMLAGPKRALSGFFEAPPTTRPSSADAPSPSPERPLTSH